MGGDLSQGYAQRLYGEPAPLAAGVAYQVCQLLCQGPDLRREQLIYDIPLLQGGHLIKTPVRACESGMCVAQGLQALATARPKVSDNSSTIAW